MTIDGLSMAVILLEGDGEIVFANEPAKEAMAEGSILRKPMLWECRRPR